MSFYDPPDDFLRHDAESERRWNRRPKCDHCGQIIPDEYMYEVGGHHYCEECFDWYIKDGFKVPVPDEDEYEEGWL